MPNEQQIFLYWHDDPSLLSFVSWKKGEIAAKLRVRQRKLRIKLKFYTFEGFLDCFSRQMNLLSVFRDLKRVLVNTWFMNKRLSTWKATWSRWSFGVCMLHYYLSLLLGTFLEIPFCWITILLIALRVVSVL